MANNKTNGSKKNMKKPSFRRFQCLPLENESACATLQKRLNQPKKVSVFQMKVPPGIILHIDFIQV